MLFRYFTLRSLILSIACASGLQLFGQTEVFVNQLSGDDVVVGSTLLVTDDKDNRSVADSLSYLENRLILNLFAAEGDSLAIGEYTVLVDLAYWDPVSDHDKAAPESQLHELNVRIDETSAGRGMTSLQFEGSNRISATILAITFNNQPIPQGKQPRMQLVGEIAAKGMNCDPESWDTSVDVLFTGGSEGRPTHISILNLLQSSCYDEFDFEWTFLDEADRVLLSFQNGNSDPLVDELFRQNATRVTSPMAEVRFNGLYRDGLVIARYRIVHYDQYGLRRHSTWSSMGKTLSEYFRSTATIGHQTHLNWQATTNFAEEAKQLPTISYLDGTLRPRQNLVRGYYNQETPESVLDEYSIAQQVIYDAMGRPAATTIPAPLGQNIPGQTTNQNADAQTLDFRVEDLARVDNLGSTDINPYDYREIESNDPDEVALSFGTASGAGRYYSPENTDLNRNAYVPNARGFPFSITRYTSDNTGRIHRQGGVGRDLQAGTLHDTRYYYGKPDQWELDRLFGVNVGYASHYEKHMVIDPNGQASVSYLDSKGRTVATALAGNNPENLNTLTTYVDENAQSITVNILDNVRTPEGFTTNYSLLVPTENTYDLSYTLAETAYCPDCLNTCQDCYYDIQISMVSVSFTDFAWNGGEPLILECSGVSSVDFLVEWLEDPGVANPFMNITLPIGEYRITKTIRISEDRYQSNLEAYLNDNECVDTRDDFRQTFLEDIDYTSCESACDCTVPYTSQTDSCRAYCHPLSPCEVLSTQIDADLRPGGQYARYRVETIGGVKTYIVDEDDHTLSILNPQSPIPSGIIGTPYYKEVTYGGITVQIGDDFFSPQDLDVNQFIENWHDSWLPYLRGYHPETCMLTWCEDKVDTVSMSVEPSYVFDLRMQSVTDYEGAKNENFIPGNHSDDFFMGDFNFNILTAPDPYFLWNSNEQPAFIDQLEDYESQGVGIFEIVREYMAITFGYSEWNFSSTTPVVEADEAWKIYRGLYLGAKTKYLQQKQYEHCLSNSTGPHGNSWRCLDQPICETLLCDPVPGNCSDQYQGYAARATLNFRLAEGTGLDNGSLIDEDLITSHAQSQLAANCPTVCAANRPIWRSKLEACSEIPAAEIDDLLNMFTAICESGCAEGNYWGASSASSPVDNALNNSSFEELLAPYFTGSNQCSEGCNPYMINWLPPLGEEVYGGHLVVPADDVPGFLARNRAWLTDRFLNHLNQCGCTFNASRNTLSEEQHVDNFLLENSGSTETIQGRSAQTCQTFDLSGPVQYISFDVIPDDPSLAAVFGGSGINVFTFRTVIDGEEFFYFPGDDASNLTEIEVGRGYEVQVIAPATLEVCGTPADPNYQLPLQIGENFIGYIPEGSTPIATYFSDFLDNSPPFLERIRSVRAQDPTERNYYPNNPNNNLDELENGVGYRIWITDTNHGLQTSLASCTIERLASFNRMPFEEVESVVRLIESFLFDDVSAHTLNNQELRLPPELNPYFAGCKTCVEMQALLQEMPTDCAELDMSQYLNAQLGWNRSLQEYEDYFETCGTNLGNCLLCPDPPANQFGPDVRSCEEQLVSEAINRADLAYEQYIENVIAEYRRDYEETCLAGIDETLQLTYQPREYHYTLYYYDQAGNLAMTVPPEGVDLSLDQATHQDNIADYRDAITMSQEPTQDPILPDHILLTHYRYNNFNEVAERDLPDAVVEYTWYDPLGRPTLSQDGRQEELIRFSYTDYDELGRTVEVGELRPNVNRETLVIEAEQGDMATILDTYTTSRYFVTKTYYTESPLYAPSISDQPVGNLRNRVAAVTFEDTYTTDPLTYDFASHYRYDAVGNVGLLVQEFVELHDIGHRFKSIEYDFDFISGNVHSVYYQHGQEDQFTYHYEYDKTNRLSAVYTSELETDHANTTLWKRDATYSYYDHGPLRRTVIGQDRLQGCDYAYTIQGWIKGVNGALGDYYASTTLPDMNSDGLSPNFATFDQVGYRDLFKYSNDYFIGDYQPIGTSNFSGLNHPFNLPATVTTQLANRELFNGNIAAHHKSTAADEFHSNVLYADYDQLHRLVSAFNGTVEAPNQLVTSGDLVVEATTNYEYDGNGNMLSLGRLAGGIDQSGFDGYMFNNLSYNYQTETNLLTSVNGSISGTPFSNDWQPFAYVDGEQTYTYDHSGNLETTSTSAGSITALNWTPYSKVHTIVFSGQTFSILHFGYGPDQNRWKKGRVVFEGNEQTAFSEYQVRDAQGNTLGTYRRCLGDCDPGDPNDQLRWQQQYLYGSARLGQVEFDRLLESTPPCTDYPNCPDDGPDINPIEGDPPMSSFGTRQYELTDHLGNVAVTFGEDIAQYNIDYSNSASSFSAPTTLRARDYLPFGLSFDRRPDFTDNNGDYRFGFNGKENDEDGEWGDFTHYDYGFRIYNPAIARFLSVDPLAPEFAWNSPYSYAENRVIQGIDLEGAEFELRIFSPEISQDFAKALAYGDIIEQRRLTYYALTNDFPDMWSSKLSKSNVHKRENSAAQLSLSADGRNGLTVYLYGFFDDKGQFTRDSEAAREIAMYREIRFKPNPERSSPKDKYFPVDLNLLNKNGEFDGGDDYYNDIDFTGWDLGIEVTSTGAGGSEGFLFGRMRGYGYSEFRYTGRIAGYGQATIGFGPVSGRYIGSGSSTLNPFGKFGDFIGLGYANLLDGTWYSENSTGIKTWTGEAASISAGIDLGGNAGGVTLTRILSEFRRSTKQINTITSDKTIETKN